MKTAVLLAAFAAVASAYINPRPQFLERAKFARWLVHESNWTVVATTSQQYGGAAFPNLMAVSDGTSWDDCSGQVYIYYTNISTMRDDIVANNTVTLGFFEAGEDDKYCVPSTGIIGHDPEDPNCAKVHMVGTVRTISNVTASDIAKKYMFWRHPAMAKWPAGHAWLTATLDIERIDIIDFYGPAHSLTPKDYLAANCK